jgi:hypothetical protein
MTKTHLVACPSCSRHVRVSESACPFCGGGLPASLRDAPAPRAPRTRLTRAALFAFGTGGMALTPACSSSSSSGQQPPVVDAAYGGPPIDASEESAMALYGGPPMDATPGDDAGPTDSGPVNDAALQDSGPPPIFDAAYGGPPMDGGTD